ncbi:Bug family tripartite tricarboxylate transporter substrate binding protein [Variovorax sp. RT4R15]|uniref:Bug family tripartite tricarboxylate transporter substrate binding protein n=1 Tax=Variovorax sp. RT4R15 TaxID=3443737 RepID=UPI003F4592DF
MPSCSRRSTFRALSALLAASVLPSLAQAQAWPVKPIKLIVPFPPGGGTDLAARIIAERLAARLGQPVVIENRPGASGAIGIVSVIASAPDGHTLLFSGSSSFTVNPVVRSKVGYDPFKQLSPVAMVARAPLVLVTAGEGPFKSLKDLLAKARATSGGVRYATFGAGSAPHLAGELLAGAAGVPLAAVPYKGSAEAVIGVIQGDVGLGIDTMAAMNPHLRSGKLRALAVVSEKRSALMPQVPAYGELQLQPALLDAWYAVAGPAGLPPAVKEALLKALGSVMAEPEMRHKLLQQSMEPVLLGPTALTEVMDSEIARYRALVVRLGLRLD